MYYVQNVWTWVVMECPANEARFWSALNDEFFHTLAYNIYAQCSTYTVSTLEIR